MTYFFAHFDIEFCLQVPPFEYPRATYEPRGLFVWCVFIKPLKLPDQLKELANIYIFFLYNKICVQFGQKKKTITINPISRCQVEEKYFSFVFSISYRWKGLQNACISQKTTLFYHLYSSWHLDIEVQCFYTLAEAANFGRLNGSFILRI